MLSPAVVRKDVRATRAMCILREVASVLLLLVRNQAVRDTLISHGFLSTYTKPKMAWVQSGLVKIVQGMPMGQKSHFWGYEESLSFAASKKRASAADTPTICPQVFRMHQKRRPGKRQTPNPLPGRCVDISRTERHQFFGSVPFIHTSAELEDGN